MRPIPPFLVMAAALAGGGARAAEPAAKPVDHSGRSQVGTASYFGHELAGKTTASGDPAKPAGMTAASPNLPLGTVAKVTNVETGDSVRVKVVDRGPYAKRRILDVSRKAARKLSMKKDGVAKVKVQPVKLPRK